MTHTISFLHSSPIHVETFDALLAGVDVHVVHSVHEEWLERAREGIDLQLLGEVRRHLEAMAATSDLVLCTCSTLGPIAESLHNERIARVDAPVMDAAVAEGGQVLLVLCLQSTVRTSRHLLERSFEAAGREPDYRVLMVPEAWPAFEAGDLDNFAGIIARWVGVALTLEPDIGCVVLGQASMHVAQQALVGSRVPILSSPGIAVEHILDQLAS